MLGKKTIPILLQAEEKSEIIKDSKLRCEKMLRRKTTFKDTINLNIRGCVNGFIFSFNHQVFLFTFFLTFYYAGLSQEAGRGFQRTTENKEAGSSNWRNREKTEETNKQGQFRVTKKLLRC